MNVKIALHCSYPEDLNPGNYLVHRQDTKTYHVTKQVIATINLRPEAFIKDTLP